MKNNKKGENDLFAIITTLFIVAFLGLLVLLVNSHTTDMMQSLVQNDSLAYSAMDRAETTFTSGLDNLFLGIFVILIIGMIVLSLFINASPIFLIVYLIISSIAIWFSAVIANAYIDIQGTGVFPSTILNYFSKQTYIMENLPYFIAGISLILLIVTYGKDMFMGRQPYQ